MQGQIEARDVPVFDDSYGYFFKVFHEQVLTGKKNLFNPKWIFVKRFIGLFVNDLLQKYVSVIYIYIYIYIYENKMIKAEMIEMPSVTAS
jgi:hypothetical protein